MDRTDVLPLEDECAGRLQYLSVEQCSDEPLIELKGVVKTFKNAAGEFTALRGVTTCFQPGEFVSIVGKSGSGKSTLANMLTGIDHPTQGSVRVGDIEIHTLSENAMSLWRGRNLGIVFQFFQLMPTLNLLENVMLPMALAKLYRPAERERRALDLLRLVGLEGYADKLPAAVSGGQQQSAAIARALANDPPIIIADEPTGNLDSRSAEEIFEVFIGLKEQGKTILMVTHDISLAERTSRTLLLADGELIHPGVAQALPGLAHNQMLWLTHQMKSLTLPAGVPVGTHPGLMLVIGGELEVYERRQPEQVLGLLRPGEYISTLDLDGSGGLRRFGVRAPAHDAACLLALDEPAFFGWLDRQPAVRGLLEKYAVAWGEADPAETIPAAISRRAKMGGSG